MVEEDLFAHIYKMLSQQPGSRTEVALHEGYRKLILDLPLVYFHNGAAKALIIVPY